MKQQQALAAYVAFRSVQLQVFTVQAENFCMCVLPGIGMCIFSVARRECGRQDGSGRAETRWWCAAAGKGRAECWRSSVNVHSVVCRDDK